MERMRHLSPKYQEHQQRLYLIFENTVCFVVNAPKRRIQSIRVADRNITSVYTEGWIAFKEFVLNICSLHNGGLSCDIRFRVNSGISNLYAADAKHHQD